MKTQEPALADYYSIDTVLAKIPMNRAAFKKLVARGGFVPRLKIGSKWFFKKTDVHRYIEDFTHAGTPDEEDRSFQDIVDEANELARKGKRKRA